MINRFFGTVLPADSERDSRSRRTRIRVLTVLVATLATSACSRSDASAPSAAAGSASCSEVEVVFARGTNQPPGLGRVGEAFLRSVRTGTPGRRVSSYAVDYPANSHQDFAPGTNDLTRHIIAVAAACPATRFVLGGYSQGAVVVAAAIGIPVNGPPSDVLPSTLTTRVAAVVAFGNPLGSGGRTIDTVNTAFRAQSADYCASEDPGCGHRGPFVGSHRSYPDNGATDAAAAFAIGRLR